LGVTGEQKSGLSSGTEEEQLRKRQWPLTRLGQFGDVLAFVLVGDFENSHLTQTLLAANIKNTTLKLGQASTATPILSFSTAAEVGHLLWCLVLESTPTV
jgi:hypothetical protein